MKYTESHEWISLEGDTATIGITDFAQKELGEVVYVELPAVGKQVKAGDEIIVLESTKAAVDVYTPVSGKITAVNETLKDDPQQVNHSPEAAGWLFKIKLTNVRELDTFMDKDQYLAM